MAAKKILVVDDSRVQLARTRREIEKAGYQVVTEENPYRAIEVSTQIQPDLIICDYTLPGMNADRLVPKFRANPATARTPVLLYSSQADSALIESLRQAGATAFLQKTGDYPKLIAKVKELLGEGDFIVEF